MTHHLDALNPKQGRSINECTKVSSHVAFFKIGFQLEKPYICVVKSSSSSVIKVLRPVASPVPGRSILTLYKVVIYAVAGLVRDGIADFLSPQEFYLPTKVTSVHFLKTKLVFGTSNYGFEVVDIESLGAQSLLDPTVSLRELKTAKSLAIYRYPARAEFLVCYSSSFVFPLCRLVLIPSATPYQASLAT